MEMMVEPGLLLEQNTACFPLRYLQVVAYNISYVLVDDDHEDNGGMLSSAISASRFCCGFQFVLVS